MKNTRGKKVCVVIGATSKWQADGRMTNMLHGHDIDENIVPVGVRWGVGGAIAQKFRGPVGQGSDGYQAKSYNYDDRLRYEEPPSFIEPEKLPWLIGRATIH